MTKKPKKTKKPDDLDTTTTFVNMNVEGFKWYDPTLDKRIADRNNGVIPPRVSRKEYWQMVRGAFSAFAPYLFGLIAVFGLIVGFAYLWLS